jgi:[acyl-carrier-protein] S-malonyltransferase
MKAYVFPGQASQFEGMGKDMYESSPVAKDLFDQANRLLGFSITEVMFEGSAEDLKQTRVTQPAVFLHSIAKARMAGNDFQPDVVAGHSLGEFSALVAAGALSFEDGLQLVSNRAKAMQAACEAEPGTMAAIIGMADEAVEQACAAIDDVVVAANYNCPGQLVISGSVSGVEAAVAKLKEEGARRAIILQVGGAFHSPLMMPAQEELQAAIEAVHFSAPNCPIYQNVNAQPEQDPEKIKQNLIAQLTSPVRWTQTMENMIANGVSTFIEVGGNGKTLQGFVRKVDRAFPTSAL